ncbi:NodT family efflux transporter outer membrane factor (OMF) lipoprotein [Altererythrobacter atlanticus]|uniref:Antibiotic efflux pump outer membrane protein ArpC n=1 Tax=Croceibacterium atlanticum TaxID=1267766 RepID=A0A0F7KTP0_9SPHN|nr:efflux transporter outer membrane subunit [Croceibacterium atlanticum]AKH42612.1 Antibiotic efflux pump outer membrane protein ArpC precursor [Croceibacterium atlanticum]MBB5731389.1 NodT family efflux transporter outer membrane factor (OMF) lipoprotein [Croceibacterium atlanticum]
MRNILLTPGLLLLAACTVGPDYDGPPAVNSANAEQGFVREETGTVRAEPTLARWWESLGDPVLDALEQRALAGNPDLAMAQARLAEARASLGEVRADRNPSLSAMGVAAHLRVPDIGDNGENAEADNGSDTNSSNIYNLGLNASWEVDLFGGHRRQVEAAEANIGAAEANLADAQVSLTSAIAQAYLNLRDRRERIILAEQAVEHRASLLEMERQRFEQGVVSRPSVDQAESRLASARSDLAPLRAEADSFLNALAILVGEVPGSVDGMLAQHAPVPLPPAEIAIGDPAGLLARRPDIRAAERQLAASYANLGVAKAAGLPRLSFFGILGIGGTELSDLTQLDDFTAIAAPMLQWNFLDFGRNRARVGQAEARQDAAEAQYRSTVLGALRDVEDALSSFRYRRQAVAELARAEASAARIVDHARQRYELGAASRRELLDTELAHNAATSQLSAARAALTLDFIAIEKALGLGWQADS